MFQTVANNHPFLDGNKRTAAACMLVFLAANHKQPAMDNAQLYEWVINVATRQLSRDDLANFLKQHCK
ncbi:type II toxin-antitoxin system death-on-curing family toxin [Methylomonas sp. WSC-7]|uniref:Type II toxin-antitoxin system death-on-curing family toxin n=1 Tax=Methylomonas rosea TaxID=2952227 RepID=A0ABT1TQ88_9GAMM|nr:type II toxin-antitoxin system death-on-curing family toxin [Methylomonas sp. WSC-7]